jgi:DNA (cytosine-5)-methyltransferase 1
MNGLALCAGYGGLELGIESFFDEYKTVCYVEGGLYPAAEIVKKMEKGWMDEAPIWSNVRTFDGSSWRGKVDIISGGFPCQPYSTAGKQLATADPRDLWPDVARIVGEVLPEYIFFENVPGIVKWRLDSIILDLHQVGYDCSWCVLGAVDAGAPHRRNRWFLFGVRNGANTNDSRKRPIEGPILPDNRKEVGRSCHDVSDPVGFGRTKTEPQPSWKKPNFVGCGNQRKWGGRFETWWQVEPSMGRLADGCSHWVDKLRLLGNGVVPQQAHLALEILTENLGLRRIKNES